MCVVFKGYRLGGAPFRTFACMKITIHKLIMQTNSHSDYMVCGSLKEAEDLCKKFVRNLPAGYYEVADLPLFEIIGWFDSDPLVNILLESQEIEADGTLIEVGDQLGAGSKNLEPVCLCVDPDYELAIQSAVEMVAEQLGKVMVMSEQ